MNNRQYQSVPTSNDLLESRVAENTSAALNDSIVSQSAEHVQSVENALPVSDLGHDS
jgi:hypothetical protein